MPCAQPTDFFVAPASPRLGLLLMIERFVLYFLEWIMRIAVIANGSMLNARSSNAVGKHGWTRAAQLVRLLRVRTFIQFRRLLI